ncbi:MAG: putative glycolipid-binding domain-containing protein [Bradyrhizobiaceae bacterium]|nr:putative glycolipid-binding domain-containing protein [Bradyrhizobiaceae bacterium]
MAAFRAFKSKTVRWRPAKGLGLEHLTVRAEKNAIVARSVVIGEYAGKPFGVRYTAICDKDWTAREIAIDTADGRSVRFVSDGRGRWKDGKKRRPEFDGCIDIDLAGSPFTNTLPIRRLGLGVRHGPVELSMLWFPFDTFEPFVDRQRYTCLRSHRLYRFEAVDGTFSATLPVDEDGFVTDYPKLFRRLH